MTTNVGKMDKIIRYILGLGIMGFGLFNNSWWAAVGLIPIVTASISWCPLYAIFGISSRGKTNDAKL